MKKIFGLVFFFTTSMGFAQETVPTEELKKNELKGNALMLVVGLPEFTYERVLNNESGVGVSVSFALVEDIETKFTLSPYYRFYFGKKTAAGFFVEGFGMLNTIDVPDDLYYDYNYDTGTYIPLEGDQYVDFALGFGVGAKWMTKSGFLFEISGGIGRNLFNPDKNDYYDHTFVGKGGITLGYRFN
jgi:hypothetical protein